MENEIKTNAKRMSPEEQYQLRKQIIRLLKQGIKAAKAAEMLGVSRQMVYDARNAYEKEGLAGIKSKTKGRKVGEWRKLSAEQEREIRWILVEKRPEQLKFVDCMWSRENVGELIEQKHGIKMPVSTMGDYLRRWGFSVQRPAKRAYKQDENKVTSAFLAFPIWNKRGADNSGTNATHPTFPAFKF